MVSKAALLAVLVTAGLLAPAPAVLRPVSPERWGPRPVALLQVTRPSQRGCGLARPELRFEMLPPDAKAPPPQGDPAVCLAVYQPWEDAALP